MAAWAAAGGDRPSSGTAVAVDWPALPAAPAGFKRRQFTCAAGEGGTVSPATITTAYTVPIAGFTSVMHLLCHDDVAPDLEVLPVVLPPLSAAPGRPCVVHVASSEAVEPWLSGGLHAGRVAPWFVGVAALPATHDGRTEVLDEGDDPSVKLHAWRAIPSSSVAAALVAPYLARVV